MWANFDVMKEVNGVLCKVVGPLQDGSTRVTVYAPVSLRKKIISQCHDGKTSGHFYYWKTLQAVRRRFFWSSVCRDVQMYCRACTVCATRKNAGRKQRAAMRRYDAGFPMEEIAIDLMGPFPESKQGNKYVLVVVDAFSKWMEAYPIPNIQAEVVAEKLVLEFLSRFGMPRQIKSDRGRQFECQLFSEMCKLLDVDHYKSTPFHPQGNSKCERMVKVVGNLISVFCQEYENWDQHLGLLTMAYRTTVHEVTGYSPNFVMLGREVSLPLDIMLGEVTADEKLSQTDFVLRLHRRFAECFGKVRENLKAYGERQQRHYNLKMMGKEFKPGDMVYMREMIRKIGVCKKLQDKWIGPYMVVKPFGTTYYCCYHLGNRK